MANILVQKYQQEHKPFSSKHLVAPLLGCFDANRICMGKSRCRFDINRCDWYTFTSRFYTNGFRLI